MAITVKELCYKYKVPTNNESPPILRSDKRQKTKICQSGQKNVDTTKVLIYNWFMVEYGDFTNDAGLSQR